MTATLFKDDTKALFLEYYDNYIYVRKFKPIQDTVVKELRILHGEPIRHNKKDRARIGVDAMLKLDDVFQAAYCTDLMKYPALDPFHIMLSLLESEFKKSRIKNKNIASVMLNYEEKDMRLITRIKDLLGGIYKADLGPFDSMEWFNVLEKKFRDNINIINQLAEENNRLEREVFEKDLLIEKLTDMNGTNSDDTIRNLNEEIKLLKQGFKQLQNKYENKKQPRKKYTKQPLVYVLTTPLLKTERRYILGKTKDLTSRLSTYNKTDEHEVVFHINCETEEWMALVEVMMFNKLDKYREKSNRERFTLPEDKDITLFTDIMRECVQFVCK